MHAFILSSHGAAAYMIKYRQWLCIHPQHNIPDISAEDLYLSAQKTKASASGLDNFHPQDLRLLPRDAFVWIAHLL